jgi:undecaprenyl-diphosphatase
MAKDMLSGDLATESTNILPLIFGFIAAFITGLVACKWMIRLVKKSQLKYFAYYCFAVGIISIVVKLV